MTYCGNCGKPLEDGVAFCGECGASTAAPSGNGRQNQDGQQGQRVRTTPLREERRVNPMPTRPERATYSDNETKKQKSPVLLIIVGVLIGVIVAVAIGAVVYFVLRDGEESFGATGNDSTSVSLGGDSVGRATAFVELNIDEYPDETELSELTLSGTARTGKNTAELRVNDELVKTLSKDDDEVRWQVILKLYVGKNTFDLELKDSDGKVKNKHLEILRTETWPFPVGTELTRTDGEQNYKIFVRPGPSKQSGAPLLEIMPGDYTTTLVYLGEYQADNDPENGFHYWYKVAIPDGREGWIRDDLSKRKYLQ